jgi:hypothetical protein
MLYQFSKTSFIVTTPNRLILRDLNDLPILREDNARYSTSYCAIRTGNVASKRLIAATLNCCFLNKRKIQTFKAFQAPDGITFLAYESQIYSAKFHAPMNSAVQQCAAIIKWISHALTPMLPVTKLTMDQNTPFFFLTLQFKVLDLHYVYLHLLCFYIVSFMYIYSYLLLV